MEPGQQFHQYKNSTYRIEPIGYRSVGAFHESTGQQVGYLGWDSDKSHIPDHQKNAISNVDVLKSHQGRGVATAMLGFAKQQYPALRHSDVLTDDGKSWSKKHPL